jgi:hypothetical protein
VELEKYSAMVFALISLKVVAGLHPALVFEVVSQRAWQARAFFEWWMC